ncbi:MAG: type II CRISPR-associated endonuclease Cas1 [Candidatus Brocadia sp. AMX2]|uniref:CRISPR-associated endonuclease Cas1 n=1 Tax=Candidatus Brocadia sinica JPN1 TaxID=1197129 RepID=A0ABQ0JU01_9BACT|nr:MULTISPECIES: type II CRISPR-associated endonuclease Cas1 [Brocadia]MBC6934065.1 type II CRISPR-associated endonuclease Cas1 [Candidatus Brocadia sp.]MBL1168952.1 type II CRISPR-associated endonuclease Cas1 [Candidatus Brocadia sp. AMX1]NOG41906.1 type II CRISPR-associated endonuclease Cas1 [Planctomycetota bacterium]GIK14766.1 MAG: CRISPR-associated endonuclease Cas1 [Candidatus Brocadia sinica]KAA0241404.1 MAG: type II CRISPR-associated endonuclease Cas1 [Candidatus Brocadia sp. AMX2]
MIKRIVEISNPARLSLKNQQMVVDREGFDLAAVPIEDIGVLILDHPQITHTQGLLAACSENNVALLVCSEKHLPSAILLPLEGNSLHSKIIAQQAQVTEPTCKRLWQAIVRAKIREQAKALLLSTGDDSPLPAYAKRVKSGDTENIEGQAARIYWQKLFGQDFRRDPNTPGINTLLNYGYAVMRAAVARAIVSTGLHPSLGLHHHNQYNSFCLADDLVEPLRPVVDLKVYELCKKLPEEPALTTENKRVLLETLSADCVMNGQRLPLMTSLHHYAASVRKVICGEHKRMEIPAL